jgi:hypothetical protein
MPGPVLNLGPKGFRRQVRVSLMRVSCIAVHGLHERADTIGAQGRAAAGGRHSGEVGQDEEGRFAANAILFVIGIGLVCTGIGLLGTSSGLTRGAERCNPYHSEDIYGLGSRSCRLNPGPLSAPSEAADFQRRG